MSTKPVVSPFTSKHTNTFLLFVHGHELEIVKWHGFLGIFLDRSLPWNHHIALLEEKVNLIIQILRCCVGAKWGECASSLLRLHIALVRQTIVYSLPVLHGLSQTLHTRLPYMFPRSLRVCFGVPRRTSGNLVIAEAKEPPIVVLRMLETCRHFLCFPTQHNDNYLVQRLLPRTGSRLY